MLSGFTCHSDPFKRITQYSEQGYITVYVIKILQNNVYEASSIMSDCLAIFNFKEMLLTNVTL